MALFPRVGVLPRVCVVWGVGTSACPTDTCAYHQVWRWLPTVPSTHVVSEWVGVRVWGCAACAAWVRTLYIHVHVGPCKYTRWHLYDLCSHNNYTSTQIVLSFVPSPNGIIATFPSISIIIIIAIIFLIFCCQCKIPQQQSLNYVIRMLLFSYSVIWRLQQFGAGVWLWQYSTHESVHLCHNTERGQLLRILPGSHRYCSLLIWDIVFITL